ncbi:MAG TPA: DUF3570 domain-containing protein, partial [Bacteroidetes bacterium]|nr:DUF3570 domain-containing protein [Bacteroidota bacterium]
MRVQLIILSIYILFSCNASIAQSQNDSIVSHEELDPATMNFIFSYYEQDGDHSPVTGGVGDEELHDYIFKISVNVPLNNNLSMSSSGGVDLYTSASTDNINNEHDLLVTETSASYIDARFYGKMGVKSKRNDGRTTIGLNGGFSKEWDLGSLNGGMYLAHFSKDENSQIKLRAYYFHDKWDMIYPEELREKIIEPEHDVKQLFDASITLTQVFNKRLKASLTIESVYQYGFLSTPFHRVYFTDTTHDIERLPDQRFKLPIGLYMTYYMNDWSILRTYYRYYSDDFGIKAHTVEFEIPLKVLPFIVVSPFYRFHTQTGSEYFKPFAKHNINSIYYSSDHDLAPLNAHKIGIGFKYSPLFGVLNKMDLSKLTKKL